MTASAKLMKFLMVQIAFAQQDSIELMEFAVNVQLVQFITTKLNFAPAFVKLMKFSMELHVFVLQGSSLSVEFATNVQQVHTLMKH